MIFALLSGVLIGTAIVLLKYLVPLSYPDVILNVYSYITLICAMVGFWAMQYNMKKEGSGITNATINSVTTVFPIIIAVLFFAEKISLGKFVGIATIVIAIILLIKK